MAFSLGLYALVHLKIQCLDLLLALFQHMFYFWELRFPCKLTPHV